MQNLTLNLNFQTLPPVVTRNRHALILIRTPQGQFVLGRKKHYPEGISRLVGGGVDEGEDPLLAASRELNEELQLQVAPTDLRPLAKVTAQIHHQDQEIIFTTWLYFYQLKSEKMTASSDLDGLTYMTEAEYLSLIEHFQHLSPELHPILGFAWSDYGQLYTQIHQIALDEYLQLGTNSNLE